MNIIVPKPKNYYVEVKLDDHNLYTTVMGFSTLELAKTNADERRSHNQIVRVMFKDQVVY